MLGGWSSGTISTGAHIGLCIYLKVDSAQCAFNLGRSSKLEGGMAHLAEEHKKICEAFVVCVYSEHTVRIPILFTIFSGFGGEVEPGNNRNFPI